MLESETENFEGLVQRYAECEATFKGGWARHYLQASGAIRQREAEADDAMTDELYQYRLTEGLVKAKRERLLSLRMSIDALRTLNANVRVQV
jgi:hypothetical protein